MYKLTLESPGKRKVKYLLNPRMWLKKNIQHWSYISQINTVTKTEKTIKGIPGGERCQ